MLPKHIRQRQAQRLSPVGRIQNNYEALYYNIDSDDPEMDEIVKEQLQKSFERYNVTIADNPHPTILRDVLVDAYKESVKQISGDALSSSQIAQLTSTFDTFTTQHPRFYDASFASYADKYEGETVDMHVLYRRAMSTDNGSSPFSFNPHPASELSYSGYVPEAVTYTTRRAYQQLQQAKDEVEQEQYEQQTQDPTQQPSQTTEQEFVFIAHEYEVDDGPTR